MEYYFKPQALNNLKQLSKSVQKRILNKLDFYIQASEPLKFAKKLTDSKLGEYRFRIGDYRVIFDLENNKIIILIIGHRGSIYK